MLDANVDALFDVPVSDSLVDDDADGGFGHVVDYPGFAVIDFVGHAVGERGVRTVRLVDEDQERRCRVWMRDANWGGRTLFVLLRSLSRRRCLRLCRSHQHPNSATKLNQLEDKNILVLQ